YPAMLLLIFGLASLGVAALFLIIQKDYKRMLAYSSVEHMGIIATGLAIGGNLGTYGALLHLFNNAMAKSMMFFASGNMLLRFRTKEIEKVNGVIQVMPVTGTVFLLGALALTGSPPFSLFVSEFTILTAGFSGGAVFASLFMLAALVLSFGGIMFHVNRIVFGPAPRGVDREKESLWATAPLLMQMFFVTLLGVYIPPFLNEMIHRAVHIIAGGNA
ncbi:MAG TPA: proton-conducting transporter membrane subunit, partial [Nitrospiria bacterium]|nr:proton-conducting transporter membrane subunit [Nitrospiria bacterium]